MGCNAHQCIIVACSAPSHYLNQCCIIINWTLGNKPQWNSNWNTKCFIHDNSFENVFCEMAAILSRGRWVKAWMSIRSNRKKIGCNYLSIYYIKHWFSWSLLVNRQGHWYCSIRYIQYGIYFHELSIEINNIDITINKKTSHISSHYLIQCRLPVYKILQNKTTVMELMLHIIYQCDYYMMVSWYGNFFRVTGPWWGESTGPQWIPLAKASDAELWYVLSSAPEQTIKTLVISDAIMLIMNNDVTVMNGNGNNFC